MSDAIGRGITVTEITPRDRPIGVRAHTTAAFIGRALRGPLNSPVLIDSFAAFCRRFGGIWLQSSLGPAVRQFFQHGGRSLYIVRVANSARGSMICLPGSHSVMVLRALEPGSTESIRAAVDYDGIVDDEHFNLTIQRLSPETGLVADQEMYQRVSCNLQSRNFIGDELLASSLVRAQMPLPSGRPNASSHPGTSFRSAYIGHAQEGSDGVELTDYDLVGSATSRSGLFALDEIDHFDLLYVPPPGKHADVGPAAMLAAELYCRRRGAMLIADPSLSWHTVDHAIAGIRDSGIASPNILSYFPRIHARDEPGEPARVAGGAIAGLLCKLDRLHGSWEELDQRGLGFDRRLFPAVDLEIEQARLLVREGFNVVAGRAGGCATLNGSVTMGRRVQMEKTYASLSVRRFCLMITNTIDHATRWAVFERNDAALAKRIQSLVHAYMCSLADAGAFVNDHFVVQCDAGMHSLPIDPHRGISILLGFHPTGSDQAISLTLHQTASGCRVAATAFAPVSAECA